MAQFMPTFQASQPQDEMTNIKYTDDPDDIKEIQMDKEFKSQLNQDKVKFFFILDRSGSMRRRLDIAL